MNETIEILQKRIERALEILKSMDTLSVEVGPKRVLNWYRSLDGSVVEAEHMYQIARILEGDDDIPEQSPKTVKKRYIHS